MLIISNLKHNSHEKKVKKLKNVDYFMITNRK